MSQVTEDFINHREEGKSKVTHSVWHSYPKPNCPVEDEELHRSFDLSFAERGSIPSPSHQGNI